MHVFQVNLSVRALLGLDTYVAYVASLKFRTRRQLIRLVFGLGVEIWVHRDAIDKGICELREANQGIQIPV